MQLWLLFTLLLFITNICFIFRPNLPSSGVQVGSYKATATAMDTFRLVQWPTTKQGASDAANKHV
jgi:hypothetical protein